jgi:hypothetical protein
VGETVRVRVEALDRSHDHCDPMASDCTPASCALGAGVCHKWKTWELDLR